MSWGCGGIWGVWLAGMALGAAACGPTIIVQSDDTAGGDGSAGQASASSGADGATTWPSNDGPPGPDPDDAPADESDTAADSGAASESDDSTFLIIVDEPVWPEACDIYGDNCPPGQKCTFYASGGASLDSTRCVPIVNDPDAVGEACVSTGDPSDGFDTCAAGSLCWGVTDEDPSGSCVAYCIGDVNDPHCEDACSACAIGSGPLALCLPRCDAIAQDCPEGQACYPVNDTFSCAPDVSDGAGGVGQPCEYINTCEAGTFCMPTGLYPTPECEGASGCCTPVCVVGDPDACTDAPEGVECLPWYVDGEGEQPRGCGTGLEIGVCGVPE